MTGTDGGDGKPCNVYITSADTGEKLSCFAHGGDCGHEHPIGGGGPDGGIDDCPWRCAQHGGYPDEYAIPPRLNVVARTWAQGAERLIAALAENASGEAGEALREHAFPFVLGYHETCWWPLTNRAPHLRIGLRRALDGKRRPIGAAVPFAEWSPDGEAWAPARGEAAERALEAVRSLLPVMDPFGET